MTVVRLKLPLQLRRSLACTNIIENMMGSVRRVCRNVKRWRDAPMALRWTGAAMQEAAKGFRRLKAHKQLPVLRLALAALEEQNAIDTTLARPMRWLRKVLPGNGRQATFNRERDVPGSSNTRVAAGEATVGLRPCSMGHVDVPVATAVTGQRSRLRRLWTHALSLFSAEPVSSAGVSFAGCVSTDVSSGSHRGTRIVAGRCSVLTTRDSK